MSDFLNEGEMRIILRWPKTNPVTAIDLDSHLYIPLIDIDSPRNSDTGDNMSCDGNADADDKCHLNYRTIYPGASYIIYTDIVSTGDNVTLDKDHNKNSSPKPPPGDETITISKVRSGTYSYSVHNYTDSDNRSITNLGQSRAKVKVFYCPVGTDCNCNSCPAAGNLVKKKFHVPNKNGTLWRVFTFNSSDSGGSGFTRVRTMIYESSRANVY
jgi:hypothetical protein